MKILFIVVFLVIIVCIVAMYLFSFSSNKTQEHFVETLKRKRTWFVIGVVLLMPFVMYTVTTIILGFVRGDDFVAYRVNVEGQTYICYEDVYYVSISDNEEKNDVSEHVQGNWIDKGYLLPHMSPLPYFHYWIPGLFLDELRVSEDKEYLYIHIWNGLDSYSEFYKRIPE